MHLQGGGVSDLPYIQAYVFTLLSSIYFSMAIGGEHEEKAVEVAH